jgi:hypothetical protein
MGDACQAFEVLFALCGCDPLGDADAEWYPVRILSKRLVQVAAS